MNEHGLSLRVGALEPSIIREMFSRRRPSSLDLSLGEPSLPTIPDLLERGVAKLKAGPQGYTENAGLLALRDAIARHHRLEGREQAENVIVTVGSEEAVFLSMISTLDPGDEVLVPEPGYPAYTNIARLIGARPITYPIRRETGLVARRDAIEERLTPRTRLCILNGPSNPFGTLDDEPELRQIAALAEARGFLVLSDEIYRDLVYADPKTGVTPEVPSICSMTRASIFVSGLSKSCSMTGLRLGYVIAAAPLVKKATLAHQLMVTCAPRLAQLIALEVFAEPGLLRTYIPEYEAAREALRDTAPVLPAGSSLLLGPGAFYGILDVSAFAHDNPMGLAIELLEQEDVVVVPGNAFGPSGTWFWRLSYAAGAEAAREGLLRIARFLTAKRPT